MGKTDGIVTVTGMAGDRESGFKESLVKFRSHWREMGDALLNISGIGTATGLPVNKDEDRIPYEHQSWPRLMYHADGRETLVNDEKQVAQAVRDGYRKDWYPKPQVMVADAATEKKKQMDVNTTLEAQIRALTDELQKMKAERAGQGV